MEKDKRNKGEKAMDRAIEGFVKYQSEADEKYRKWEEERWRKETELDEKRRKKSESTRCDYFRCWRR
jgi:hypothetical protein